MGKLDKVSDYPSAPAPITFEHFAPVPINPEFQAPPAYSNFKEFSLVSQQDTHIVYPTQFNTSVIPDGNVLSAGNCPPLDRLSSIPLTPYAPIEKETDGLLHVNTINLNLIY